MKSPSELRDIARHIRGQKAAFLAMIEAADEIERLREALRLVRLALEEEARNIQVELEQ